MKHFSSNKYLAPLFVAFLGMTGLSSCIYDKFDIDDQPEQKPYVEGNYIGMQIELPVMTRDAASDWEKLEDYIDQDSFQLIFVYDKVTDGDGKETDTDNYDKVFKTFLSSQLSIIPIADSYQGQVKNWYVQIPLDEDFEKNIRENNFKIAVIANWPVNNDEEVLTDGDPIHKLHHIDARNPYKDSSVFSFLGEGGKFSPFKDYVKSKNEDITADGADNWIRANWNPALEANKKEGSYQKAELGDYYDLWLCWNLGGNLNAVEYPGQADAWEKRNGAYLRNWITKNIKEGETEGALVNLPIVAEEEPGDPDDNGNGGNEPDEPDQVDLDDDNLDNNPEDNEEIEEPDENYSLTFKTVEGAMGIRRTEGDKTYYGVKLPKGTLQLSEEGILDDESKGVFSFLAPASGTLYITAKSTDSNSVVKVQIGNNDETTIDLTFEGSVETQSITIEITGDSPQLYIYNDSDTPVEIYQIEYVQGKYLYDTAWTGVTPEEEKIAMYGIQTYKALDDYWMEGTSFDLSNFNRVTGGTAMASSYEFKNIYLLRSVAKVVLLIPEDMDPHNVILRSQNRYARSEPVDVSTPTDDIWKDNVGSNDHNTACEFFSILGHTPFYNGGEYKTNLSWYYGSWSVNGKLGEINVPAEGYGAGNDKQIDYPHIMNPLIERSEFTEFLYTGNEGGMERYVLYVPEKFVDDPAIAGNPASDPKVCHIEFRIDDDPRFNLDDNECYRIYFIEDGYNKEGNGKYVPQFSTPVDNWEDKYEKDTDNLKKHWPIMRNHIYTFTVEDANKRFMSAKVNVLAWARKDIVYDW